jgi:hypothetical protein
VFSLFCSSPGISVRHPLAILHSLHFSDTKHNTLFSAFPLHTHAIDSPHMLLPLLFWAAVALLFLRWVRPPPNQFFIFYFIKIKY